MPVVLPAWEPPEAVVLDSRLFFRTFPPLPFDVDFAFLLGLLLGLRFLSVELTLEEEGEEETVADLSGDLMGLFCCFTGELESASRRGGRRSDLELSPLPEDRLDRLEEEEEEEVLGKGGRAPEEEAAPFGDLSGFDFALDEEELFFTVWS